MGGTWFLIFIDKNQIIANKITSNKYAFLFSFLSKSGKIHLLTTYCIDKGYGLSHRFDARQSQNKL